MNVKKMHMKSKGAHSKLPHDLPGPLRKSLMCSVRREGGIPLLLSISPGTVCSHTVV